MHYEEDLDTTTDAPTNDVVKRHTDDDMPSATSTTPARNTSPFLLQPEDVETLLRSDGFSILREHLHEHYNYDLCEQHTTDHLEELDRWLIVRDVLHALLVPVVELFDKAVTVASQATHATKLEDLEYAFSGSARSAFVWLQCFLSAEKEQDWCYTRGCPACVVEHSLDSEFSIRLLYAACLLSDVHYPFTLEGPTLPSFMFFLDSLARALEQDPLWRDNFYELMQPKAIMTRDGIEELIHQCLELDCILISQASSPSDPSSPEASVSSSPVLGPVGGAPGMKVKRSKMARRQMKLKVEEEAWMEEMLRKLAAESMPGMTLSEREGMPQSLDAVVKAEPVVVVTEVAAVK
ncbi:hypothetical protein LTR78_009850 [Recurvomyces mirabilis]|uniref:Uncharacterized protein n=1 Tax=Recurvomyces mirabilis TaxID=574656 RepID=A0AAE0WF97_9PEZI|nr:hypothetical protein LTR78_009850 [Recurvomyces mirabilis]KAK5153086.1 hypothetical protein LTS14_007730 [Recurvomyces mirabilis]